MTDCENVCLFQRESIDQNKAATLPLIIICWMWTITLLIKMAYHLPKSHQLYIITIRPEAKIQKIPLGLCTERSASYISTHWVQPCALSKLDRQNTKQCVRVSTRTRRCDVLRTVLEQCSLFLPGGAMFLAHQFISVALCDITNSVCFLGYLWRHQLSLSNDCG